MKFNDLFNYKNAFSLTKVLAISLFIIVFLFSSYLIHQIIKIKDESSSQIWVKTQDGSMFSVERQSTMSSNDRIIEYKHHVRWFYFLWYNLNKNNYENNINTALNLISPSKGSDLLDEYQSQGVIDLLSKTGRRFNTNITSDILINADSKGITGSIKGIIIFYDSKGSIYRKQHLDVEFEILDNLAVNGRLDKNPHGVEIIKWNIINDSQIIENK